MAMAEPPFSGKNSTSLSQARSRRPAAGRGVGPRCAPDHLALRCPEGVADIFAAAELEKPDISILSDEFLTEVRGMPQRNLAVELLRPKLGG